MRMSFGEPFFDSARVKFSASALIAPARCGYLVSIMMIASLEVRRRTLPPVLRSTKAWKLGLSSDQVRRGSALDAERRMDASVGDVRARVPVVAAMILSESRRVMDWRGVDWSFWLGIGGISCVRASDEDMIGSLWEWSLGV
mgnify:CR=1 FL=1